MREIAYDDVVRAVRDLCVEAAYRLNDDVLAALNRAARDETDRRAREMLDLLVENADCAVRDQYPLCQDTGLAVVFVEQGCDVHVACSGPAGGGGLAGAIEAGVAAGFRDGYLRQSVVADPAGARQNTGTNTPAIIHPTWVEGDRLKISVMLKGGGSENRSRQKMLTPADGAAGVEAFVIETVRAAGPDACPPLVVGVGIGGNFELSALLAKRALLRRLDRVHPEPFYAEMERRLLAAVNGLGIGPQGMGGRTTALAVLIETHPCHIASLPVAVNIECHSHRHKSVEL